MNRTIPTLLLAFLLSGVADAQDGLVIRFKITKSSGDQSSSYTDSILMRINESTNVPLRGKYEMHVDAKALDGENESVVFTIKDLSSGVPVYVGSAAVTLKVGQAQTVPLHQLEAASTKYELFIDTSYGQLPQGLH